MQSAHISFAHISFPSMQAAFAFYATILYFVFLRKKTVKEKRSLIGFHTNLGFTLVSFGALCIAASLINLAAVFFQKNAAANFCTPENFSSFCFSLLLFAFAAWFEEIMYRGFLPFAANKLLHGFFSTKINFTKNARAGKIIFFISETFALFSFALSHRYLGFASVVNAFLAGLILRACFVKTKTPFTNFFAHFLYNVFFLLLKMFF